MQSVQASATAASSAPLLTGTLLPSHTSTLNVAYTSYPTPWPILILSIVISIVLGHIGWKSAFRSWHPHADMTRLVPEPGTDMYVEMEARKHELRQQNRQMTNWDYAHIQDTNLYDPNDDRRLDGGVGFWHMLVTLFGAGWTTLRVIFTFVLVLAATIKPNASLPDPWSVIVLLVVCQIYMSSRAYPRAVNLLMAVNISLMFAAIVLSAWGPRSSSNYYGKMDVVGGNCPYFYHNDCPLGDYHLSKGLSIVGCETNSTWNQAAMGYPRAAFFDTGGADPNRFTFMYHNREFVRYGGLIIAIFALSWTLYMVIRTQLWRDLMHPLPELKMAKVGDFSTSMAYLSYFALWLFILYALIGHIIDEVAPTPYTYVDSFGPPLNVSVFTSKPGSTAWDQSHDSSQSFSQFYGGNSTTWSDCFIIKPRKSADGNIGLWWNEQESKTLRILAQV